MGIKSDGKLKQDVSTKKGSPRASVGTKSFCVAIYYSYLPTFEAMESSNSRRLHLSSLFQRFFHSLPGFPSLSLWRFSKLSASRRDLSFSQWILVYLFYISHVSRRNTGSRSLVEISQRQGERCGSGSPSKSALNA